MDFSTFSLKQLKAHTLENNIFVTGDRRTKQAYIDSIHHHQMHQNIDAESVEVVAPIEAVEVVETIEVVESIASESIASDNPKISSVVALQPFAFILAAVIIGVIYLAVGIILNAVTIIKRSTPFIKNAIAKLSNPHQSKDSSKPKRNYQYILE